jgi:hypothetical protein
VAVVVVALVMLEVEVVAECPMGRSPSRPQLNTASPLAPAVPEERLEVTVREVVSPALSKVRRRSLTVTAAKGEVEASLRAADATD